MPVTMSTDRYVTFTSSKPGRAISRRVGLPPAVPLRRYEPGQPLLTGPAYIDSAPGGRLLRTVEKVLADTGCELRRPPAADERYGALVLDASGIGRSEDLRHLHAFFAPAIRRIAPNGRLLVLGTPHEVCEDPRAATAQRALEGFTRAAAKEVGRAATGQLVLVEPGGEEAAESTLRFLLSARSAYVSGQAIRVGAGAAEPPADWERAHAGQVAVVTGAARGIGAAIAATLARDGAEVVCVDVPAQGEALADTANRVGGSAFQLDITGADAPAALAQHLRERHGRADLVVHNAGITRDKTLGRMAEDQWESVIAVNLAAPERLTEALLDDGVRRIVCVSSVSGIAGNRGQTNYAASKAGLIGMVQALAPRLAGRATINAVAPGFIETRMTAAMPVVTREAGRRMNSLTQGGQPVDVAETVAWLGSPASGAVTGNIVRVCGQSILGA
jgi:3-oxoacyl-[acyl-carrier protein] reductase